MDFETFSTAIPPFDGTRPYQQIPFQFSLHVVDEDNATARHYSFLAYGTNDPRHKFIDSLKKVMGDSGSIVVYNQGFEKGVLNNLATFLPKYNEWVENLNDRIIDLFAPFRSFNYYDTKQKGSASLKKVLPVLTGRNYEEMNITNGGDASVAFVKVTYGNVSERERNEVREDLEKYCCLDTEGMIWIVEKLKELIK